ncbi:MAG TPA: hypothetical protein VGE20_05540 [Ramlibacter sp.]
MQTSSPLFPSSSIDVPEIDSDEPVAVIPVASVAPLDGPPGGERINTFALAPAHNDSARADFAVQLRDRVIARPLTHAAGAFLLGFVLARALR